MIYLDKAAVNNVALTLWENRLTETDTYALTLTSDFTQGVEHSVEVTDTSLNPVRFNLFMVDISDTTLKQGWYSYAVTEAVPEAEAHTIETGRCWIQNDAE